MRSLRFHGAAACPLARSSSARSRRKVGDASSGGMNGNSPPTCIIDSRVSPARNIWSINDSRFATPRCYRVGALDIASRPSVLRDPARTRFSLLRAGMSAALPSRMTKTNPKKLALRPVTIKSQATDELQLGAGAYPTPVSAVLICPSLQKNCDW